MMLKIKNGSPRAYTFHRVMLIMIAITLTIISVWFSRDPYIQGDGIEYLAMTSSIVNHRSPDLRRTDVTDLLSNPAIQAINANYMRELLPAFGNDEAKQINGYFRSKDGRFYSYHFWLYPIFNAPGFVLSNWLHIDPVNSFLFTNVLILLLASILAVSCRRYSIGQQWALFAFIWLGGSSLYVNWSSPEVFTFSTMVMAGIELKNRRYFLASFLLALAAQQNPPVGLLSAASLLLTLPNLWRGRAKLLWLSKQLAKGVLVCVTLLLSPLFYFISYGTSNLIAHSGQASAANISAARLVSFFFDLNQGMVIGIPGLAVAGTIALLYLCNRKRFARLPLGILLLAAISTLLMVIPSLSTINFNSGSSGMARYALWCAVPSGFALIELIGCIEQASWQWTTIGSFVFAQLVSLSSMGTPFNGGSYLELRSGARFLLRHSPSWYSPVPEVFAERISHRDGGANPQDTYFYVHQGQVVRVLFDRIAGPLWLPPCPSLRPHTDYGSGRWTYLTPRDGSCRSNLPDGGHVVRRGLQGDIAPVLDNVERSFTWKACSLPSQVGVTTPQCDRIAKADVDKPGYMVFGPYVHLPAGRYQVSFLVRTHGGPTTKWDVAASGAGNIIVAGKFDDTQTIFKPFRVSFTVPDNMDGAAYEFRIYFTGQPTIEAESVTLKLM